MPRTEKGAGRVPQPPGLKIVPGPTKAIAKTRAGGGATCAKCQRLLVGVADDAAPAAPAEAPAEAPVDIAMKFINAIRRNLKMSGATMPNKDIKAVSTAPLQTAARPQSPPPPIPEHRTSPFLPPPPGLQIARHRRNRLADGRRDRSFRAPQGDRPGA